MTLSQTWGRPAFFVVEGPDDSSWVESGLSRRNRGLLAGAANFHALENQGAVLTLEVYFGRPGSPPRLTDIGTRTDEIAAGATRAGRLTIRSTAAGPRSGPPRLDDDDPRLPETGVRHILLPPDTPGDDGLGTDRHISLYWRMRRDAERSFPILYDYARQVVLSRRERELQSHRIPRVNSIPGGPDITLPEPPPGDAPQAVLLGLHWLEIGGAERWALETVRAAREAGHLPVVITDRESQHPWIDRPELDGALVIPLNHPTGDDDSSQNLLRALLENLDVRGVFVHHCQWLYDRLPWLRAAKPGLPVVDSLHIIEYAGGGYPAIGAHFDDYIDIHHVISPQLETWLESVQAVDPGKIVMAPLVGLTSGDSAPQPAPRVDPQAIVVSFIGRYVRQKRPYLFLTLVKRLVKSSPVPVRAIMQGGGELEDVVRRKIAAYGLEQVVELRPHDADVAATLAESDVLVISSQNEGLTLTTFEALAAGIPVVSADVGSQDTLVTGESLLPRAPGAFARTGAAAIVRFARDESARVGAWRSQVDRATEFSRSRSASSWAPEVLESWKK